MVNQRKNLRAIEYNHYLTCPLYNKINLIELDLYTCIYIKAEPSNQAGVKLVIIN